MARRHLRSYLARVPGSPTPLDAAGNRLNNAPEWSGSGSAVYVHAAGGRRDGHTARRRNVAESRVLRALQRRHRDATQVWAPASARSLRAEEPPVGTGRLRAQHWQPGVCITSASNVPLTAYVGRPGDPRHWGTNSPSAAEPTLRRAKSTAGLFSSGRRYAKFEDRGVARSTRVVVAIRNRCPASTSIMRHEDRNLRAGAQLRDVGALHRNRIDSSRAETIPIRAQAEAERSGDAPI